MNKWKASHTPALLFWVMNTLADPFSEVMTGVLVAPEFPLPGVGVERLPLPPAKLAEGAARNPWIACDRQTVLV